MKNKILYSIIFSIIILVSGNLTGCLSGDDIDQPTEPFLDGTIKIDIKQPTEEISYSDADSYDGNFVWTEPDEAVKIHIYLLSLNRYLLNVFVHLPKLLN